VSAGEPQRAPLVLMCRQMVVMGLLGRWVGVPLLLVFWSDLWNVGVAGEIWRQNIDSRDFVSKIFGLNICRYSVASLAIEEQIDAEVGGWIWGGRARALAGDGGEREGFGAGAAGGLLVVREGRFDLWGVNLRLLHGSPVGFGVKEKRLRAACLPASQPLRNLLISYYFYCSELSGINL
jgi:hypothetical protein